MTKLLIPLLMLLACVAGFAIAVAESAPLGMIMTFGFGTVAVIALDKAVEESGRPRVVAVWREARRIAR